LTLIHVSTADSARDNHGVSGADAETGDQVVVVAPVGDVIERLGKGVESALVVLSCPPGCYASVRDGGPVGVPKSGRGEGASGNVNSCVRHESPLWWVLRFGLRLVRRDRHRSGRGAGSSPGIGRASARRPGSGESREVAGP